MTTFTNACTNGDLNQAQQLWHAGELTSTLTYKQRMHVLNTAFRWTCAFGHLNVAKWLLGIQPKIDVSAEDEFAFRFACSRGHLAVVKWLLFIKPTIDVSRYDEFAFRFACNHGHLHVAKWLLFINPTIDIHTKNQNAFCAACENGHLHVAKWLFTVKPLDACQMKHVLWRFALDDCHSHVVGWILSTIKPTRNIIRLAAAENAVPRDEE